MVPNDSAILIFTVFTVVILIPFAYGAFLAAPWIPMRKNDVKRMLQLARITPNMLVVDLGSGDGRVVLSAARDFGARAVGYEVALLPLWLARVRIYLNGLQKRVRTYGKNFFHVDLGQADIITAFLTPRAMQKLEPKFDRELKPGCRVITYAFPLPNWQPDQVAKEDQTKIAIYYYTKK